MRIVITDKADKPNAMVDQAAGKMGKKKEADKGAKRLRYNPSSVAQARPGNFLHFPFALTNPNQLYSTRSDQAHFCLHVISQATSS